MRITQKYLDLINEILPKATAEAAYCIGIVSALAWESRLTPDRSLIESALKCKSLSDVGKIFDQWKVAIDSNRGAFSASNRGHDDA